MQPWTCTRRGRVHACIDALPTVPRVKQTAATRAELQASQQSGASNSCSNSDNDSNNDSNNNNNNSNSNTNTNMIKCIALSLSLYIYIWRERKRERERYTYINIQLAPMCTHCGSGASAAAGRRGSGRPGPQRLHCITITVSFHNFKSQNFKLSVSNPKSKYVAYSSVLYRIQCNAQRLYGVRSFYHT